MIKAYLIDDEKKIIALIEHLINWDELGIQVIGSANSGQKGLEAILELKPDIVITDIRMPGLDGLEMIRRVRETGLKVHFILISGHKHFEYAQSAIKYGVENYLLKPINKQELLDNLTSVRDKILNEKIVMSEQINLESRIRIASEKMRKQFITRIVNRERLGYTSWEELNQEYMLKLAPGNCQIIAAKADLKQHMEPEQITIANHKIFNELQNELKKISIELEGIIDKGYIVFFVNFRDTCFSDLLDKILEEEIFRFDEYCDITIGLSEVCDETAEDFDSMYLQAMESIYFRMFLGLNRVIPYSQVSSGEGPLQENTSLEELRKILEIRERGKIQIWLKQLGLDVKKARPGSRSLMRYLGRIYDVLRITFYETASGFHFPMEKDQFMGLFTDMKSAGEMTEILRVFIWNVLDEYEAELNQSENKVMRTAKDYIARHYAENISLEMIAGEIYMNPAYFSVLFKKEEGINFSDYLTNYRIERAKEFLKDGQYSIYDVGCMVGYKNSRYFSRLFLKTVGIKPSEFRKLYL